MEEFIRTFKDIVHIHDRAFRYSMMFNEIRHDFLQTYLPEVIKAAIDLNSITSYKETFVNSKMASSICDTAFKIDYKYEKGYMVVLVEHQSSPNPAMALRIENYKNAIRDVALKAAEDTNGAPFVYPLVLYHGKGVYNVSADIAGLTWDPAGLHKDFGFKPVQLINLNDIDDDDFSRQGWSGIMNYAFKHIYDKDASKALPNLINMLGKIEGICGESFFEFVLQYFCDGSNIEKDKLWEVIYQSRASITTGVETMTFAEECYVDGEKKGVQKGIQKGIQKGVQRGIQEVALFLERQGASKEIIDMVRATPLEEVDS